MGTAANPFPNPSQPISASEVWSAWSADFEKRFTHLRGAGYRVRTDDIQLGKITNDPKNPGGNDSNPFPGGLKSPPSPTGKGFAEAAPESADARWFGGWPPPLIGGAPPGGDR
jgi:hypothetical protein